MHLNQKINQTTDNAQTYKASGALAFCSFLHACLLSISFTVVMLFVLISLSLIFNPKDNTFEAGMIYPNAHGYLAEPENTLDVVFIGDSEVYSDFIPLQLWRDYGITACSISSPWQRANVDLEELRDVLKTQKPKVVMVDLRSLTYACTAIDIVTTLLGEIFPVIKYHARWDNITLSDFDFQVQYTFTDPYKGYYYNNDSRPVDSTSDALREVQKPRLDFLNSYCVKEMSRLCNDVGSSLIIVGLPSYKYSDENSYQAGFQISQEFNLKYLNLNFSNEYNPEIDWQSDTYDKGEHLNFQGAVKSTKCIGDFLFSRYEFTDKRGDASFKSWEEASTFFFTAVANGNVPETWPYRDRVL